MIPESDQVASCGIAKLVRLVTHNKTHLRISTTVFEVSQAPVGLKRPIDELDKLGISEAFRVLPHGTREG